MTRKLANALAYAIGAVELFATILLFAATPVAVVIALEVTR